MVELDRDRAESTAAAVLRDRGIDDDDAALTAEVLVSADACGKHSHGLRRLPRFVRGIDHGNVSRDADVVVDERGHGVALVDGGSRLGPVVATAALTEATRQADQFGVGTVGVHDGNHLGMLGYYTDRARREGYVALAMTNTEPAMPPHGGSEPILGTNPIAIGFPTDPAFNLDMSTSSISRGEVLGARERGERLPEGIALDADGEPTTDPAAALDGVILPVAGAKGSGLAIAVEVLAGGLVGAAMGRDVTGTYRTEQPCTKGDLFVVVDPDAFVERFVDRVQAFLADLTASQSAAGVDTVRLPGERSSASMRNATRITVDDDVWDAVLDLRGDAPRS